MDDLSLRKDLEEKDLEGTGRHVEGTDKKTHHSEEVKELMEQVRQSRIQLAKLQVLPAMCVGVCRGVCEGVCRGVWVCVYAH